MLYQDLDNTVVATPLDASVNVTGTVVADPGETYTDTVAVPTVALSYFAPDPTADPAPALDEAYLEVNATVKPVLDLYGEHFVHFTAPIPPDHLTVALPDGTTVAARYSGGPYPDPDDTDYVLSGTYYFPVPADTTTATLHVAGYTGAGWEFVDATGSRQQISLAAFAVPLTLNAAPTAPARGTTATTPPTTLRFTRYVAANPASTGSGHGSSKAPLALVVVLLAGAATIAWAALRRRRRPHQPQALAAPLQPGPGPSTATPVPVPVPVGATTRIMPVGTDDVDSAPTNGNTATGASTDRPPVPTTVWADADIEQPPPDTEGTDAGVTDAQAPDDVAVVPDTVALSTVGPQGAGETPARWVALLGPCQVAGLATASLRPREIEVFLFLAVNGEPAVTNDEIRNAVAGPDDAESNARTIRTYLSRIRAAVGNTVLPDADAGRYHLVGVDTDIAALRHHLHQAAAAPVDAARSLADALGLVRGRPFAGYDFRWTPLLAANLERDIADAADRLADIALRAGDSDTAIWAAERGLTALTQPDDRLLAYLLRARATRGPAGLTQGWREVTARYSAVGDVPGPELVALYDHLRQPQRHA